MFNIYPTPRICLYTGTPAAPAWWLALGFTDRVDDDPIVSLEEYGIIRRPSDGLTILGSYGNMEVHYDYDHISIDQVRSELQDMPDSYFEYYVAHAMDRTDTGDNKDSVLEDLDNERLAGHIRFLGIYHDQWDYQDYNLEMKDIIAIIGGGK